MEIKKFSFFKLVMDAMLLVAFIYSQTEHLHKLSNVFIWVFWVFSILALISAFSKPKGYLHSKCRAYQTIFSELAISCVLVYFDYPVLATVGFISGLLFAGSRMQPQDKD